MSWTPHPRGAWVDKLVAFGTGAGRRRPLDGLAAGRRPDGRATAATGLDDTGDDWFRAALRPAMRCARRRGRAPPPRTDPGPGRATADPAEPPTPDRPVDARAGDRRRDRTGPIIVTGLGRSGTTLLHELLACDPDNRAPLLWELVDTVPSRRRAEARRRSRPAGPTLVDDQIKLMDEMVPAFTTMHENRRPPSDRVHLRLRPPVLQRHVHRSLQRSELHDLAERHRPDPHLRLAPPDAPDPPVGRRADRALGAEGAIAPVAPAPGVRHLSRRPGGHHPPRPVAGGGIAGRHDGDPPLDALRPRRLRHPG